MKWSERARYRARQFWGRFAVHLRALDDARAAEVLPESAYALFASMPPGDRQHGLCVLEALGQSGEVASDLAQAALLHDVGKAGGGLSLPYRVAVVLMQALSPSLLDQLGAPPPHGLRRPFYVHRHHAELGAALCERAGCSALTVRLVQHHQESAPAGLGDPALAMLAVLRAADERC